jgi:hypothetical protein
MAIVYEKLLNLAIPTIEQTYAPKDAMLYALGVGLGLDPIDRGPLDFVFEKNRRSCRPSPSCSRIPAYGSETSIQGSTRSRSCMASRA